MENIKILQERLPKIINFDRLTPSLIKSVPTNTVFNSVFWDKKKENLKIVFVDTVVH